MNYGYQIMKYITAIISMVCMLACLNTKSNENDTSRILLDYEDKILELKKEYNLPSLSLAIVSNKKIIYSNGFGYSDIERKLAATDSTPYRIASVTKPIASTIILKLVADGHLELDGKIKDYWKDYYNYFDRTRIWIKENAPQLSSILDNYDYERDDITIKHHLSHTAEGTPGENFKYSGFLYSSLSKVVDNVSDRNFYQLVKDDIIIKLDLNNSLPQQSDTWRPEVVARLAKPYFKNENNQLVEGEYPQPDLAAGAGIISTVLDLAKFDIALDNDELIPSSSKNLAFTPAKLNNGKSIPYGLGWFIGEYKNYKVVYHTGWQPAAFSAMYLKVIDKNLTLILLANSEDLTAPFMQGLGAGQIESSPFAKNFLDLFL